MSAGPDIPIVEIHGAFGYHCGVALHLHGDVAVAAHDLVDVDGRPGYRGHGQRLRFRGRSVEEVSDGHVSRRGGRIADGQVFLEAGSGRPLGEVESRAPGLFLPRSRGQDLEGQSRRASQRRPHGDLDAAGHSLRDDTGDTIIAPGADRCRYAAEPYGRISLCRSEGDTGESHFGAHLSRLRR